MKRIIVILANEPVVILAIVTGVVGILAKENILPGWVPLVTLAIATPIQRALVSPRGRVSKLLPVIRKELNL